jgi:allantoate deiminase
VQALGGERLPFAIEVIAFSEEEGVRFRTPYLGSRAICGTVDSAILGLRDAGGATVADALTNFGLDPGRVGEAVYPRGKLLGYLEAHIEQGPILDTAGVPLGVVEAIAGQSRLWLAFAGKAGHAGTMPMELRQDALVAAAEFIVTVEKEARAREGLRATVGTVIVAPGAANVVPGAATVSLDVRHAQDQNREQALQTLLQLATAIARRRGMAVHVERIEHHAAVPADARLSELLMESATAMGQRPLRMVSGAGHDAAMMAGITPMAMLFLRSLAGISHHPDEAVVASDVAAALEVMATFLRRLAGEKS